MDMEMKELMKEISAGYIRDKENIELAIGIISDNKTEKLTLGNDCVELPQSNKTYEIGSITKTFTANLFVQAIENHKLLLTDEIINNITIKQVLTHTSNIGELPVSEQLSNNNPFDYFTKIDILKYIDTNNISNKAGWEYSNLGYALLGMHSEKIYDRSYSEILEDYIKQTLHLLNTKLGFSPVSILGYNYKSIPINWIWRKNNVYLSAGGLISTLDDMLEYLRQQMHSDKWNLGYSLHAETDMPFDMGLGWMIEKETGITFCMGLTEGFSAFIGFNKRLTNGIVILSNYCGPGYRQPDTTNGIGLTYLDYVK